MRLYALVVFSCLAFLGVLLLGINVMAGDGLLGKVATPDTTSVPDPIDELAAEERVRAAEQEAAFLAKTRQGTAKQAAKEKEPAERRATERTVEAAPAIPPDTTMYLTVPKLGLYDIPVLEGTSEAVLSQGAGHVPSTGYPWVEGSNTYIAGHRLGYPGTVSDHVFWGLPSLAMGDQIVLEDSLGQSYTYQVSEILEVSPYDLSVTGATGSDVVSLQTCTENYGDYWTAGPNWLARYIVRANRVG